MTRRCHDTTPNIIFKLRAFALDPAMRNFREAEAAGHTWCSPSVVNTETLYVIEAKLTIKNMEELQLWGFQYS